MKIYKNIYEWQNTRRTIPNDKKLGVVPTMGALHEGHLSLIKQSKAENDFTLVTIFLNPTQFNNKEDLVNYPATWNVDVKLLKNLKTDYLLAPDFKQIYPDNYNFTIKENKLSKILCGSARPGHFDGVLTVVMKLLMLADADRAYFGEKDFQQLLLVKKMAEAFFVKTEIVPCPTIREKDGLALSSRNRRLSSEGRKKASEYARIIKQKKNRSEIREELEMNNIKVDYLEEFFGRRFAAVFIDNIRLIDNFKL